MKTTIIIICSALFLFFYIPYWSYQRMLTRFRAGLKMQSRVKYMLNRKPRQGVVTRIFLHNIYGVKDSQTGKRYPVSGRDIYPMIGGKKGGQ